MKSYEESISVLIVPYFVRLLAFWVAWFCSALVVTLLQWKWSHCAVRGLWDTEAAQEMSTTRNIRRNYRQILHHMLVCSFCWNSQITPEIIPTNWNAFHAFNQHESHPICILVLNSSQNIVQCTFLPLPAINALTYFTSLQLAHILNGTPVLIQWSHKCTSIRYRFVVPCESNLSFDHVGFWDQPV